MPRLGLAPSPIVRMLAGTTLTSLITTGTSAVVIGTLADRLGPEQFGSYILARRMVGTVHACCSLAMGMAIPRYVAMAQNESERRAFLLGGLMLGVIPGLLIAALSIALPDTAARLLLGKAQSYGLLAGALIFLIGCLFMDPLYGFYRGQGRMMQANAWQLAVFALGPAVVVYGPVRPTEAGRLLLCLGLVACSSLGPLLPSILDGLRDKAALRLLPDALGDLWCYGWPRVPAGFMLQSMLALGPLLASYHFGMAYAGFLLAGQAIFQMVEVAIYSFHIVMLPRAAVLHAEGHVEVLREMVSDVITFISHVGLYATLHLLVWSRALILAWLGDLYADAVPLMRLLLVAVIPYTAHIMLRSFIDAVDHRPVNTINLGIALLGVMLASLLALNFGWGAAGLALSTSLGYWMLAALSVRYLRSHFDLRDHQFMVVKLVMANVVLLLPSLGMAGLLQTYLNRAIILAFAALVEGILFLIFCAVMWRSGARWMSEVMKRIVADAAL